MESKIGSFCAKHNEYSHIGVCRWCEPVRDGGALARAVPDLATTIALSPVVDPFAEDVSARPWVCTVCHRHGAVIGCRSCFDGRCEAHRTVPMHQIPGRKCASAASSAGGAP